MQISQLSLDLGVTEVARGDAAENARGHMAQTGRGLHQAAEGAAVGMDLHLLAVDGRHLKRSAYAVLQGHDQVGVLGRGQRARQRLHLAVLVLHAGARLEHDLLDEGLQAAATGEGRDTAGLVDEGLQELLRRETGKRFGLGHHDSRFSGLAEIITAR